MSNTNTTGGCNCEGREQHQYGCLFYVRGLDEELSMSENSEETKKAIAEIFDEADQCFMCSVLRASLEEAKELLTESIDYVAMMQTRMKAQEDRIEAALLLRQIQAFLWPALFDPIAPEIETPSPMSMTDEELLKEFFKRNPGYVMISTAVIGENKDEKRELSASLKIASEALVNACESTKKIHEGDTSHRVVSEAVNYLYEYWKYHTAEMRRKDLRNE